MGSFTSNIGLSQPTPGDPAVANLWGGILNTNFGLIDNAIAGLLSKSVAGSANVVLTVSNGSTDEARYKGFIFTGVLTGNINVLWPGGVTGFFMVKNSTTGAFTLSLGVNNGSGLPVGSTSAIAQGATGIFYSDGTNVSAQLTTSALSGLGTAAAKAASDNARTTLASVFTAAINKVTRFVDNVGTIGDTGINYLDLALLDSGGGTQIWTAANIFSGSQHLRLDAGDASSHPIAFMDTAAASQYSGRISWGTGAPGALAEGEIYLQYT